MVIVNHYFKVYLKVISDIFMEAISNDSKSKILFFDEIDTVFPSRNKASSFSIRLITQFLSLFDGIDKYKNIKIIGSTNRPNSIDRSPYNKF